ncbi:hypothetical protein PAMP_021580 [Pampus punctatissimus]
MLRRLIEEASVGFIEMPFKKTTQPSMRFRCKSQASLLEEDGVVSSSSCPSLSSAIFILHSLIHYVFSRCSALFYSRLPTNRETENEIMALHWQLLYKSLPWSTLEDTAEEKEEDDEGCQQ